MGYYGKTQHDFACHFLFCTLILQPKFFYLTILNKTKIMKKITFHFVALLCAWCFPFLAMAQITQSCFADNQFPTISSFIPSSNVANTGCDAVYNPHCMASTYLEAYVYDGTKPALVVIEGTNSGTNTIYQKLTASTFQDPDVAILYYQGNYYINVVYTSAGCYFLDVYKYVSGGVVFFSSTNLSTLTNAYPITGFYFTGANIDANETNSEAGIVLQDISNTANIYVIPIYGYNTSALTPMLGTPVQAIQPGINPDIACVSDEFLITYLDLSGHQVFVDAVATSDYYSNIVFNLDCDISISGYGNPRIATSKVLRTGNDDIYYSWTVVTESSSTAVGNNYQRIYGANGAHGYVSPVQLLSVYDYTNANSIINNWLPSGVNYYDLTASGAYNNFPVVSYNEVNDVEIAWTTNDPLQGSGSSSFSGNTVVGIMADNFGNPYGLSPYCNTSANACYGVVPNVTGACGNTGVFSPNAQNCASISGRNINSGSSLYRSTLCYYDQSATCTAQILSKDSYVGSYRIKHNTDNNLKNLVANNNTTSVNVYPNPFTESITIQSTNLSATCSLILTDVGGRELLNTTNDITTLNTQLNNITNKLSAGIYFIKITNGSNTVLNQKVVKM